MLLIARPTTMKLKTSTNNNSVLSVTLPVLSVILLLITVPPVLMEDSLRKVSVLLTVVSENSVTNKTANVRTALKTVSSVTDLISVTLVSLDTRFSIAPVFRIAQLAPLKRSSETKSTVRLVTPAVKPVLVNMPTNVSLVDMTNISTLRINVLTIVIQDISTMKALTNVLPVLPTVRDVIMKLASNVSPTTKSITDNVPSSAYRILIRTLTTDRLAVSIVLELAENALVLKKTNVLPVPVSSI